VFKPEEFLNLILTVNEKQQAVVWDDAGYWLFALDWYEEFVKAESRFMQLAGTLFGAIILTTPNQTLISSKVMASLPNYYVCNVTKTSSNSYTLRPRIAKVYESWNYPDGKKGGVCGIYSGDVSICPGFKSPRSHHMESGNFRFTECFSVLEIPSLIFLFLGSYSLVVHQQNPRFYFCLRILQNIC